MAYTQDQINAAYATERANGASDADLQRIGAGLGVTTDQFNLATAAYGPQPGAAAPAAAPAASAPAAALSRFEEGDYQNFRNWATGKSFDEIGAVGKQQGWTAEEIGQAFGKHGGSGQQVMAASKYGTAGWDGWQDEAAKWSFSGTGWDYAGAKKPPTTGINLSQLQGMTRWDVAPNETVRSQLQQIIAEDSPLMQQARARAMQTANTRGLLNSSMAATAGESALYDAAMPIATQDAATYARSGEFNANTANTFSRDNNAFVRDAYMADFNVQANEWAAQQQFDRDYKTLDRQQQLTLERDAIQNGYQSARDQFAAQQQTIRDDKDITARMSLGQMDLAGRMASVQPDTSMERARMQLDQGRRDTLINTRNDGADKIFRINTSDMSPEQKDAAIESQVGMTNKSITNQAAALGITPDSWLLDMQPKTTDKKPATTAPPALANGEAGAF